MICYLVAQGIKITSLDNKWLPVICGILGGLLGIAGMYFIPDFPGRDPITSIAIGIVSGLAATGMHQVYKQMKGNNSETEK